MDWVRVKIGENMLIPKSMYDQGHEQSKKSGKKHRRGLVMEMEMNLYTKEWLEAQMAAMEEDEDEEGEGEQIEQNDDNKNEDNGANVLDAAPNDGKPDIKKKYQRAESMFSYFHLLN